MQMVLQAMGSRGDIQPFVALGVGLKDAGHAVRVVGPENFADFVTENGLGFAPITADIQALAESEAGREMVNNPLKAGKYMKDLVLPLQRRLLQEGWQHSQDAEVVIYHPKALSGYHIAEKLGIPGFFTMPVPGYHSTAERPSLASPISIPGAFNKLTYTALRAGTMAPFMGVINEFREETLGLPPIKGLLDERAHGDEPVPALYAYSQHVIPRPDDWPEHVYQPGYFFLERASDYTPPADLVNFIQGGEPPVYIGFGSMPGDDARRLTQAIAAGVKGAGVRAVVLRGWGGIDVEALDDENIFVTEGAPHDWLFPQMGAVVHHGGAGTVAAGLKAGKPTLVISFFGDQPMWGRQIENLGVGPAPIKQKQLTGPTLASALVRLLNDGDMAARAADLGAKIRAEDGVGTAVSIIERIATQHNWEVVP